MPKRSIEWNKGKNRDLFAAVLTLRTTEECGSFFRDLCTLEEIAEMADRWQMVRQLVRKQPYRQIAKKLGVSTTTVARVAQWLYRGKGGYALAVKRLKLD